MQLYLSSRFQNSHIVINLVRLDLIFVDISSETHHKKREVTFL